MSKKQSDNLLKISEELEAYINYEFPRMVNESEKLEQERSHDRKRREIERKKRPRQRDNEIKSLSNIREYLQKAEYKHLVKKVEQSYENKKNSILRKEGDSTKNPLKSKSTLDDNNFLYACYRHIKKENPLSKDIDIHKWIEKFLEEKEYKIKGKTVCDFDIIRERISTYKKMPPYLKHPINSLIDDSYKRFVARNFPSK